MAKDRRKLQHIHSSIADKQPTPNSLEVGEIAVNTAEGKEFLSIKNTNDKVVRFSSDAQMIDWVENKEVIPYSGTVDNVHLDTNRSNIEIKLNQVVAQKTAKYDVVNGAKDIDGNDVNPSSDGGRTNGAGFAIDMSQYAMIGANPSFSSVTVTHQSNLSGTTNISNGAGGSKLNITTTNVETTNTNWTETIASKTSTISNKLTENINEKESTIGTEALTVNGTSTINRKGAVLENNHSTKTVNTSGNVVTNTTGTTTITNTGDVTENNLSDKAVTTNGNLAVNTTGATILSSTDNMCITSQAVGSIVGKTKTNVGKDCSDANQTSVLNLNGNTINLTGATVTQSGTTVNVKGSTVAISGGTTNISGGTLTLSGGTITYYRNPSTTLTSTTVDNALEETLSRSAVTMKKITPEATSEILATYQLFQNGSQIGEDINIPKDHLLKSADIVYGTLNGSTFEPCPTASATCHWYIKLTWNVFDPSTSHADDKVTYMPADDFIKDINESNPTGVAADSYNNVSVNVWYDGQSNKVSATTTPTIHASQNIIADGYVSGDTISATTSIYAPTINATNIKTTNLSSTTITNASGITTNTLKVNSGITASTISATTINVSNGLGKSLTWSLGVPSADTTGYNGSTAKTITIPSQVKHMSEYSNNTLDLTNSTIKATTISGGTGTFTGNVTSSGGFYQTSDVRFKKNVENVDFIKCLSANKVAIKQFNYIDDESNRLVYGIIAQDAEFSGIGEIVYTDENGKKSVDYTSLTMLKMAYLENENKLLRGKIAEISDKLDELLNKSNS